MSYDLIDSSGAVALLEQLMGDTPPFKVLRLLGEPKMGKSHLLTKVVPTLARARSARHAIVGLRG
jgi:hypothetical protein